MTQKKEYNDLSGPFNPDLTFESFSKELLLKLINIYQYAWVQLATEFLRVIGERYGMEVAEEINLDAWRRMSKRVNPRYAKVANIPMKTVIDSVKALQLPLDNTIGPIYRMQYNVIDENHVIMTLPRCRTLESLERDEPHRISTICQVLEKIMIEHYLMNDYIKVVPLKLPPRASKDEICCKWELTLEKEKQPRWEGGAFPGKESQG
ncbi:MAG: hypothetical protein ISS53_01910 [Dehalococcoidia bacterium]|nr:hypothetical protein [Dehalococcoidia bacterium]